MWNLLFNYGIYFIMEFIYNNNNNLSGRTAPLDGHLISKSRSWLWTGERNRIPWCSCDVYYSSARLVISALNVTFILQKTTLYWTTTPSFHWLFCAFAQCYYRYHQCVIVDIVESGSQTPPLPPPSLRQEQYGAGRSASFWTDRCLNLWGSARMNLCAQYLRWV